MHLYTCTRLSARISLAACEANRARDIDPKPSVGRELPPRPWGCRNCVDWQAWGTEPEPEKEASVAMKNSQSKTTCTACGATEPLTRGMCRACYQRAMRAERKAALQGVPSLVPAESAPVGSAALPPETMVPKQPAHIYLATPYTHEDAAIRCQRFETVTRVAGQLMVQGSLVFSPITMGHPISELCPDVPHDFAYWEHACLSYLSNWATSLDVLMLPGWEESRGVRAEIAAAKQADMPIRYLVPVQVA